MKLRARHLMTCLALLAALMALPAAGASASTKAKTKAAIKAALNSYDAQLETADTHVVAAVNAYTASKDAAAVQSAISEELTVLRSIRTTVKSVSTAGHPVIRRGKTDVLLGLRAVMAAYEHLSKTYADAATSPKAAKSQYAHYVTAIKRGLKEIRRGVHLV